MKALGWLLLLGGVFCVLRIFGGSTKTFPEKAREAGL